MDAEVEGICGDMYREKSEERVNSRNGYRPPRPFDTGLGTLDLHIPKLRKGSYYPSWLLKPLSAIRAGSRAGDERSVGGWG